jgi:hypothetical protein
MVVIWINDSRSVTVSSALLAAAQASTMAVHNRYLDDVMVLSDG